MRTVEVEIGLLYAIVEWMEEAGQLLELLGEICRAYTNG